MHWVMRKLIILHHLCEMMKSRFGLGMVTVVRVHESSCLEFELACMLHIVTMAMILLLPACMISELDIERLLAALGLLTSQKYLVVAQGASANSQRRKEERGSACFLFLSSDLPTPLRP